MKFTKEEISLCKQVAGRHRKDIEYGDWYFYQDEIHLWTMPYKRTEDTMTTGIVIPLWTISDCLEFLVKKNYRIESVWQWSDFEWEEGSIIGTTIRLEAFREIFKLRKTLEEHGNTLLEACLNAVLAVLEEEKS